MRRGSTLVLLVWLGACSGDDGGGEAGSSADGGETCVDGCIPDTGAEAESTESTGDESGTQTGTADTTADTTSGTTDSDGTDTGETGDTESSSTDGGAECPAEQPQNGACGGKLACEYGDTCCLCDPDMGCDEWTCGPNVGGVFCPDEYPGVGAQCPMEAISCRYCVAEDPALFCTNGQWIAMAWCF